ncbi:MAG: DUF4468 domain-containing protein [Bacteroidia bacterium]|nr:DUF4468 domain-containing protein [Bacteroidia bacterium]
MKKKKLFGQILILSFLLTAYIASAQTKEVFNLERLPVDVNTKLFTYLEVVLVPQVSATQMFTRGINWFHKFYKNPTDVIRETDSLRGTIDGKSRFKIYNPPDKKGLRTDAGNVEYSIQLGCKDGKFRYKITDINWKQTSYYPIERWMDTKSQAFTPTYLYYLEETDSLIHEITLNLESFMKTSPLEKKDDW